MVSLAKLLIKNKIHEDEAVGYLGKLIAQGSFPEDKELIPVCLDDLAECFEKGCGVKKSNHNALHYYRLAADKGNTHAQNRLGNAYLAGELDLTVSVDQAVHYYQLSASRGSVIGYIMLGQCFERGDGVEKSAEKAFFYYQKAAEIDIKSGWNIALFALARCHENGIRDKKIFR